MEWYKWFLMALLTFSLQDLRPIEEGQSLRPMATVSITPNVVSAPHPATVSISPAFGYAVSVSGFSGAPAYQWSILEVPPGSANPVINDSDPFNFNVIFQSFGAPGVTPGLYRFQLRAFDFSGNEAFTTFTVIQQPPVNIQPEVAVASISDQLMPVTNLEVSGTVRDPLDNLSYAWTQESGPSVGTLPAGTVARGVSDPTTTNFTLNDLAPGTYRFRLTATDDRSAANSTNNATVEFTVTPPPSTVVITFDPISTLETPVNNVPLNAQITGISPFNDQIQYSWAQNPGNPTPIALPPNTTLPLGTSNTSTTATLNALAFGTYSFTLTVTDGYYPSNVVQRDITFTVAPPPSNLNVTVSVNPAGTSFTKPIDPAIVLTGTLTGVNPGSDQVRYYWRQEASNPSNIDLSAFPKTVTLGTTELSESINIGDVPQGNYVFWFSAVDIFYNTGDSAEVRLLIREPVRIEPVRVFTPNGDGINDLWEVRNIQSFPELAVKIINERGQIVFQTESYASNPWDGTFNGRRVNEGAYYYIFTDNRDNTEVQKGSFVVIR